MIKNYKEYYKFLYPNAFIKCRIVKKILNLRKQRELAMI
jgi:hypothetical protein